MNFLPRLFFSLFGFAAIILFANGFMSSDKLSHGQILMLHSLIPMGLFSLAASFYKKGREDGVMFLAVMLYSIFIMLLCTGMQKQTDDSMYAIFAWLGVAVFLASIIMMIRNFIQLENRAFQS